MEQANLIGYGQMISFPAPALCQGADEDLLLEIGSIMFPGCITRWPGENGLRLWVEGKPTDPAAGAEALARFQTVLGVLRAWGPRAGELRDERRRGLGEGSVRDEAGNQWVTVGQAIEYRMADGEVEKLAAAAAQGINTSQNLRIALWFIGRKGVSSALGLSKNSLDRLGTSANNLSPLAGGRHANDGVVPTMGLDEQREYIAELLRRWIAQYE